MWHKHLNSYVVSALIMRNVIQKMNHPEIKYAMFHSSFALNYRIPIILFLDLESKYDEG